MAQQTTVMTSEPSATGQLFLLIVGERVLATELLPARGTVVIGRAPDCEIRIDDVSLSRNHAVLHLDPLRIVDTRSANGTWVDDRRIEPDEPVEVRIDQVIRLGSVTVIVQRRPAQTPQPRRVRTYDYFVSRVEDECDRKRSFAIAHILGHDAAAIREVASGVLGVDDLIAPYAADELELLLLGADVERGGVVVRAIETALDAHGLDARIGLAWYPRDGRSPSAVIARARDRAHGQVIAVEPGEIVVDDPRMRALHELVERVAAAEISVLLQGETGVGKEVFAESIHRHSPRASKPFLKVNCAALSETLIESELFGHERGAFTGAVAMKPGLFEVAEGGVVFLDEIGEMPLGMQAKLLRVLDDRKVLRVGGVVPLPIDVRIVSATNRDLDADVRAGTFRQDLLYRLNTMSLIIPPLRERTGEIIALAARFLAAMAAKLGRPMPRLTDEALALLRSYRWPGNVRELRNVIERAVVLANRNVIDVRDLPEDRMRVTFEPPPQPPSPSGAPHSPAIDPQERQRILDALETCNGNQTHAANLLGISRRTLINKLDKFALPRPRKR